MEQTQLLNEQTTSADIAGTDTNLTVDAMFQQSSLPSLARQIFSIVPVSGPTGAIFNIRKKPASNAFELLRQDVNIENTSPISTSVSREAIQDMRAMFGKEVDQVVGKLLRGLANEQENTSTLAFLNTNSLAATGLTLTNSLNAETNFFEITKKVHELILKMNSKGIRTYEAFAVIPYVALGGILGLSQYAGGEDKETHGLFVAHIGMTKFYLNPDPLSTTAYVGLKDSENMSKSSAIFSPYQSQIVEAQQPDTGEVTYNIFNRYAITASPLHVTGNEMLYKFTVTV